MKKFLLSYVFKIISLLIFYLSVLGASSSYAQDHLIDKHIINANSTNGIPQAGVASYWDEIVPLKQDYIIVGAGIVGLSTAIEIKKSIPKARVLVLDGGTLASGASTRNAGFACFGSLTEIYEDIVNMGEKSAIDQIKDRWSGLNSLRKELGDDNIGFSQTGNYEIISAELLPLLNHMKKINNLLKPIFGEDVFVRNDSKISQFGLSQKHVSALVFNRFEGKINSGKMMESLQKKALSTGVVIRYGSNALRPYQEGQYLHLPVKTGSATQNLVFKAKAIAICVNGFTTNILPEVDIRPGRGQILVTESIKDIMLPNAPFHIGKGFWYFRRLDDDRILIGGGRNLNIAQEATTDLNITSDIVAPLKKMLNTIIIPDKNPKIDFAWAGVMGFSRDHRPIIKKLPNLENVVVGFGCNGMGVARGYDTGKKTAKLLMDSQM